MNKKVKRLLKQAMLITVSFSIFLSVFLSGALIARAEIDWENMTREKFLELTYGIKDESATVDQIKNLNAALTSKAEEEGYVNVAGAVFKEADVQGKISEREIEYKKQYSGYYSQYNAAAGGSGGNTFLADQYAREHAEAAVNNLPGNVWYEEAEAGFTGKTIEVDGVRYKEIESGAPSVQFYTDATQNKKNQFKNAGITLNDNDITQIGKYRNYVKEKADFDEKWKIVEKGIKYNGVVPADELKDITNQSGYEVLKNAETIDVTGLIDGTGMKANFANGASLKITGNTVGYAPESFDEAIEALKLMGLEEENPFSLKKTAKNIMEAIGNIVAWALHPLAELIIDFVNFISTDFGFGIAKLASLFGVNNVNGSLTIGEFDQSQDLVLVDMLKLFTILGYSLALCLFAFNLFSAGFGHVMDVTETPLQAILRFLFSAACIFVLHRYIVYGIVYAMAYTQQYMMGVSIISGVSSASTELQKVTTDSGVITLGTIIYHFTKQLGNILQPNSWTTDNIMTLVLGFIICKEVIKFALEIAERYLWATILQFFAPLAFATVVTKRTSKIVGSYITMLFCQYLMLILSQLFMKTGAIIMIYGWIKTSNIDSISKSEALITFILVLAWFKIGQKADEFLQSMGLNVASTGGNLMSTVGAAALSIAGAAGMMYRGARFAKNAVAGGTTALGRLSGSAKLMAAGQTIKNPSSIGGNIRKSSDELMKQNRITASSITNSDGTAGGYASIMRNDYRRSGAMTNEQSKLLNSATKSRSKAIGTYMLSGAHNTKKGEVMIRGKDGKETAMPIGNVLGRNGEITQFKALNDKSANTSKLVAIGTRELDGKRVDTMSIVSSNGDGTYSIASSDIRASMKNINNGKYVGPEEVERFMENSATTENMLNNGKILGDERGYSEIAAIEKNGNVATLYGRDENGAMRQIGLIKETQSGCDIQNYETLDRVYENGSFGNIMEQIATNNNASRSSTQITRNGNGEYEVRMHDMDSGDFIVHTLVDNPTGRQAGKDEKYYHDSETGATFIEIIKQATAR